MSESYWQVYKSRVWTAFIAECNLRKLIGGITSVLASILGAWITQKSWAEPAIGGLLGFAMPALSLLAYEAVRTPATIDAERLTRIQDLNAQLAAQVDRRSVFEVESEDLFLRRMAEVGNPRALMILEFILNSEAPVTLVALYEEFSLVGNLELPKILKSLDCSSRLEILESIGSSTIEGWARGGGLIVAERFRAPLRRLLADRSKR